MQRTQNAGCTNNIISRLEEHTKWGYQKWVNAAALRHSDRKNRNMNLPVSLVRAGPGHEIRLAFHKQGVICVAVLAIVQIAGFRFCSCLCFEEKIDIYSCVQDNAGSSCDDFDLRREKYHGIKNQKLPTVWLQPEKNKLDGRLRRETSAPTWHIDRQPFP